jgi:ADP-ribose pyrophosphatase
MPLFEDKISGEKILTGRFLQVHRDTVRLPDESTATREYIEHPGAVMILAVLPDGQLVMERQFRYPIGRVMLEFPAGKIDPGEDPLACAKRELLEETGYVAAHWQHYFTHHPLIAYSTERIEFYLATELTLQTQQLDPGEFLEVLAMSPAAVLAAIKAGEITDGKTTSGFLIAQTLGLIT